MKRLAMRVALVLALPVGLEGVTRLDDWLRYSVPFSSGATGIADLLTQDSLGLHARANTRFRQFDINADGFRGSALMDSQRLRATLVAVAGSSETFGLRESARHEWPMQMQDDLARRCAPVEIVTLNAAMHGMSMLTSLYDLEHRVLAYRPRVVVYYPQPTQYLYGRRPQPVRASTQTSPPPGPYRLRALPRIREAIKGAIPAPLLTALRSRAAAEARTSGETLFTDLPTDRVDAFASDLRQLVGAVRAGSSEPVLVIPQHRFSDTLPTIERDWLRAWEKQVPKANAALLLRFADASVQALRQVARDSNVALAEPDLGASRARMDRFSDYVHFTDAGAAIVAASVADAVSSRLGCGGSSRVGSSVITRSSIQAIP